MHTDASTHSIRPLTHATAHASDMAMVEDAPAHTARKAVLLRKSPRCEARSLSLSTGAVSYVCSWARSRAALHVLGSAIKLGGLGVDANRQTP